MTLKKLAKFSCAALTAAVLSGCGIVDDVQLNGKIFDAVGINSTGSVKKEAKVAERSPLVVPPSLDKLPEPGANGAAQASAVPGVEDHDAKMVTSQAELEKQQAEYCKVNYEQAMQRGDTSAESAAGPLGPCRASIFTAIKKWTSGDEAAQ
jgi:hypothetical protein